MRAVLFDVDGVLLDSIGFHRGVWQRYCDTRQIDFATVWPTVIRSRWPEVVAIHASEREAESELELLDDLCSELQALIVAPDGVPELLRALPPDQWGIVTSGSGTALAKIFPRLGLPLPRVLVDGARVSVGKPHPEATCWLRTNSRFYLPIASSLRTPQAGSMPAVPLACASSPWRGPSQPRP